MKEGRPGFWALWKIGDAICSGFVDNKRLNTIQWRVYERKEEPKEVALYSI